MAATPRRRRKRVLWAGRFDRQKRFDLVMEIARQMPEVDFDCWGKAVLNAPPDLSDLPPNVTINGPFKTYDDLPLTQSDGWLYTSAWDGLPTILIELASKGLPVVASAVGGVPELIDNVTGWPVGPDASVGDYCAAIRDMLASPDQRVARARALQTRARTRHSRANFRSALAPLLDPAKKDL